VNFWPAARSRPAHGERRVRASRRALMLALCCVMPTALAATACGAAGESNPRDTAQAAPAASQPAASRQPAAPTPPADLTALVLRRRDLPRGFVSRPLTSRNLPSELTGCRRLQQLTGHAIGRHEQVEFFRLPIGPWLDEAVMVPAHGSAAELSAALAKAIAGCAAVTVTEEGERVRLSLAPGAAIAAGQEAHAFRAGGKFGGIPLRMDIVLIRSGGVVMLLTNTALAGTIDSALTTTVARAAAARAAHN
jgi:hypothetical protein